MKNKIFQDVSNTYYPHCIYEQTLIQNTWAKQSQKKRIKAQSIAWFARITYTCNVTKLKPQRVPRKKRMATENAKYSLSPLIHGTRGLFQLDPIIQSHQKGISGKSHMHQKQGYLIHQQLIIQTCRTVLPNPTT